MPLATKIPLQTEWPTSPLSQKLLDSNTTLPGLVQYFFEWGVGLGGLAVFIALIIAGVQYITSIADPGKINDAKARIRSSLIGLVLLLSSWAIFNLINPNLNTLSNLPDISKDILKNAIATGKSCNQNWECCEIPGCNKDECSPDDFNCCVDLNCAPENFACCQKNDARCIKHEAPPPHVGAPHIGSLQPNGSDCIADVGCESNLCACDRTEDPWKLRCAENPRVCINIIGQASLGCDFVVFYEAADFTGTATEIEINNSNTNWIKPQNTSIKSYQALKYATDRQGNYIDANGKATTDKTVAKKIPCGRNSCGCQISICDDISPSQGYCVNPSAYAFAFNANLDGMRTFVNVKDETKGGFEEIKKSANWLWDNTIGWIFK